MSKHWIEPYTEEAAKAVGIHGNEGTPVVGDPSSEWIYCVRVRNFTFGFFSLDMMREYLDFYSRKILPTSRFYGVSPFSDGPAASVGDGQSKFERLPGHLRKEGKRVKVQKALQRALEDFDRDEHPHSP